MATIERNWDRSKPETVDFMVSREQTIFHRRIAVHNANLGVTAAKSAMNRREGWEN